MKHTTKCRVCGTETIPYFDYGDMPLVNRLFDTKWEALEAERFPQELRRCPQCYLSQLSVVVDPEILYANYPYRSSVSVKFKNHCRRMALQLVIDYTLVNNDVVIDIAGNDGAFINELKSVSPWIEPYIVDPSQEAMDCAIGVTGIRAFWNAETAAKFAKEHGQAKLINAQNVVAHVDDVHSFFEGIKIALRDDGIFVMEVPHVVNMLQETHFEPVYHEHLSYMSATALNYVGIGHGLTLVHVEKHDIHCGTLRAFFMHEGAAKPRGTVLDALAYESILLKDGKLYDAFRKSSRLIVESVQNKLCDESYKKIIGITASAKGNVLLNMLFDVPIYCLIDQSPPKIGKFAPGVGLEIKDLTPENVIDADLAVILASNVSDEMERKLREAGFAGEIFTP